MPVAGGVIHISGFTPVNDTTPPDKIQDFRITIAGARMPNVYTFSWTAPGDDLNIGVG